MRSLEDVWAKFKIVHEPRWLLTGSCVGDNDNTSLNCKTKSISQTLIICFK